MSERHLTATQRRRTQRREGPPQMRLALWALEPEARRGLRAKPTKDGMGAESQAHRGWDGLLALLLRDLGGCSLGVWLRQPVGLFLHCPSQRSRGALETPKTFPSPGQGSLPWFPCLLFLSCS